MDESGTQKQAVEREPYQPPAIEDEIDLNRTAFGQCVTGGNPGPCVGSLTTA